MAGAASTETQEALQEWGGYMFKDDLTATPKLESLLRGIAKCIARKFEGNEHADLTPRALAAFYNSVGGSYDQLFLDKNPQSVAFIYKNLSCPHSLQPDQSKPNVYSDPVIPALKPRGFTVWQSIQLLLGPEQHVPFLQEALRIYDIRDPNTREPFPRYLPPEAFPPRAVPRMVTWHDEMSQRLLDEARRGYGRPNSPASSSGDESEGTIITADAAHHFANPLYKNKEGRPAIMRQLTKGPAKVFQGGLNVAQNVFHGSKIILSPNSGNKKSRSRSRSQTRDEYGRDDNRRNGKSRPGDYRSTPSSKNRPNSSSASTPYSENPGRRGSRREASPATSDEEDRAYMERQRKQKLRRHRSQEEQPVRRDFANSDGKPRRHNSLHQTSERLSRNHSYESGSTPQVSDIENQLPNRYAKNWTPSSRQPSQMFQAPEAASQRQYDSPVRPPQNRNDYSTSLGQQQQNQAQAQGVRWDRGQSSQQVPQRPDLGLRTSSADGRGRGGRRVSFIDLSKHEEGYMSSTSKAEERPPPTPGIRSRSNGAPRFTEYRYSDSPAPADQPTPVTPSAQEEWDGLKKGLSGKGSNGSMRGREEHTVHPIVVEPAAATDDGETLDEGEALAAHGGRRNSIDPPAHNYEARINGVKGRRYTVDAPWTKEA